MSRDGSEMARAFARLPIGLQTVAGLFQQRRHRAITHWDGAAESVRPPVSRHFLQVHPRRVRVPAGGRLNQRHQRCEQLGLGVGDRARPPPGRRMRMPQPHGPSGSCNSRNPARMVGRDNPVARAARLTPPQPTSRALRGPPSSTATLVQFRRKRSIPRRSWVALMSRTPPLFIADSNEPHIS